MARDVWKGWAKYLHCQFLHDDTQEDDAVNEWSFYLVLPFKVLQFSLCFFLLSVKLFFFFCQNVSSLTPFPYYCFSHRLSSPYSPFLSSFICHRSAANDCQSCEDRDVDRLVAKSSRWDDAMHILVNVGSCVSFQGCAKCITLQLYKKKISGLWPSPSNK